MISIYGLVGQFWMTILWSLSVKLAFLPQWYIANSTYHLWIVLASIFNPFSGCISFKTFACFIILASLHNLELVLASTVELYYGFSIVMVLCSPICYVYSILKSDFFSSLHSWYLICRGILHCRSYLLLIY